MPNFSQIQSGGQTLKVVQQTVFCLVHQLHFPLGREMLRSNVMSVYTLGARLQSQIQSRCYFDDAFNFVHFNKEELGFC